MAKWGTIHPGILRGIMGILMSGVAIAACRAAPNAPINSSNPASGTIVVASKDFTEQDILGELLAQQIEKQTTLKVDRRPRLGGSYVCHQAIINNKIDVYVEYTGTAATVSQLYANQPMPREPQKLYQDLQQRYAEKFNLAVLPGLGFENTFAIVIRGEDAARYNVKTLSQIAPHTPQWQAGFGYEFVERQDGLAGLAKTYDLQFAKPPQAMDLGLIYRALLQKQIDLTAGNSTDGQIARLGFVVLQDDRRYFPPYEAVPIVRQAVLTQYPELRTAIAQLAGRITAEDMRRMNDQVESELRDVKAVVREFLQQPPRSQP